MSAVRNAAEAPWQSALREFAADPVALAGSLLLAAIIVAALLAPMLSSRDPYDVAQLHVLHGHLPPGSSDGRGRVYWLGTDDHGRDMLSATLYGLRTSLVVGVAATVGALVLGVAIGLTATFAGGRIEALTARLIDVLLSFPALLIALMLIAVLGHGTGNVIVAVILVQWAYYASTVRSAATEQRQKPYVEAARGLGLSGARVALRHVVPNCLPPLMALAAAQIASAIGLEATLSFLGLGVPDSEPSLGLLIAEGFQNLLAGKYWITLFPGIALVCAILCINLVADQLRDVLRSRPPR